MTQKGNGHANGKEERPCKIQQHNESNCVYKIYNDRL